MEGFNAWWPLKGSMFSSQWEGKKKNIFHLFSLCPQQILFNFFFPLMLRFYFTKVLNRYFMPFIPFP
jgi:hypothetical protein